jgi:hypothetical protein
MIGTTEGHYEERTITLTIQSEMDDVNVIEEPSVWCLALLSGLTGVR